MDLTDVIRQLKLEKERIQEGRHCDYEPRGERLSGGSSGVGSRCHGRVAKHEQFAQSVAKGISATGGYEPERTFLIPPPRRPINGTFGYNPVCNACWDWICDYPRDCHRNDAIRQGAFQAKPE